MKLAAGLGNPGPRYDGTRHNVGFLVIDEIARRCGARVEKYERRFEALLADVQVGEERVLLAKPQTFMNLSGRSMLAIQQFYKISLQDILVVCDDMDLPPGQLRLRASGSGGGQKGLENILLRLSSNDIPRLRVGIGRAQRWTATDHVLGRFSPDEREDMESAVGRAADAAECWLREGVEQAMNRYNVKHGRRRQSEPDGKRGGASEGESS